MSFVQPVIVSYTLTLTPTPTTTPTPIPITLHLSMPQDNTNESDTFELREQDRWLPIANVDRVMRAALPANSKISKDAKESMQECVSEFISFITSQAAEKCQVEKRKTLNGEDILYALHSLGFENYAEILRIYLAKYRIFELDEVEKRRAKYIARKNKLQKEKLNNSTSNTINTTTTTTTTTTNITNITNNNDNNDLSNSQYWELDSPLSPRSSSTRASPQNSEILQFE